MHTYPLVSVLMPVYNAEKYLAAAIESILNQPYTHFEFLIFNDGSTEASAEIIRGFHDERIRFVDSSENTGYVSHLNAGIEMAKGKYRACR
ncbi:MAG: glycosyltransferase [Adhaeribacter sp.]|nr:glycosyltransferase [Adhaeribacter sp.]